MCVCVCVCVCVFSVEISMSLPLGSMCWSVVCDYGNPWSYLLAILLLIYLLIPVVYVYKRYAILLFS